MSSLDLDDDFVVIGEEVESDEPSYIQSISIKTDSNASQKFTTTPSSITPLTSNDSEYDYTCDNPALRTESSLQNRNAQIRAFTGWLTWTLNNQASASIPEVLTSQDLSHLLSLNSLSQIISFLCKTEITSPTNSNSAYEHISNLGALLDIFKKVFPNNDDVNASSIVYNNISAQLDLAWSIIYHSYIHTITYLGLSDRFALLLWYRHIAAPCANAPIVENFLESFSDGIVMAAVLETRFPNSIQTQSLSPFNKASNLRKVFDLMELHLGVPKLLTAMDVVGSSPDELSIVTYLACIFKKYQAL